MSANGETSTVLRGVTHGAVDFLIKPVRIEELRNVWQHVVRRRRTGSVRECQRVSPTAQRFRGIQPAPGPSQNGLRTPSCREAGRNSARRASHDPARRLHGVFAFSRRDPTWARLCRLPARQMRRRRMRRVQRSGGQRRRGRTPQQKRYARRSAGRPHPHAEYGLVGGSQAPLCTRRRCRHAAW